ncbi:MAG: Mur ligase family protein [bacterium]
MLEYGIDRPKEMEFLVKIAKPDIGVFTAIDAVHSEQFGNPAEIAKEEVKMIKNTKEIAFLNANDTYAQQLMDMIHIDKISYQTQGHELTADIHHSHETFHEKDGNIQVSFDLSLRGHAHRIQTNLLGKPNY